jgi:uncharacterized repeat protein (TIGR04138 family)
MEESLRDLALRDGRYKPEAFRFLFESLEWAVRLSGKAGESGTGRHVTGQELLSGMRVHAEHLFGPLAARVWRSWGIHETLDWGNVVFLLVEAEMLNREDSDTLDDFREGFDFDEAFVKHYEPKLGPDEDEET